MGNPCSSPPRRRYKITEKELDQMVNQLFFKFDSDRNGTIDKHELEKVMLFIMEKTGKEIEISDYFVDLVMKKADKNNDGKIQRPEMKQVLKICMADK